MNAKDEFMDAIYKGLAALAGSFLNTAAKKGLAITLLIIAVGTLVGFVFEIDKRRDNDKRDFETRLLNVEARLEMCNTERLEQAVKIARLDTEVKLLKHKR